MYEAAQKIQSAANSISGSAGQMEGAASNMVYAIQQAADLVSRLEVLGETISTAVEKVEQPRPVVVKHNGKEFTGRFHKWTYREVSVGELTNSGPMGLVERDDGTMAIVPVDVVQFVDGEPA